MCGSTDAASLPDRDADQDHTEKQLHDQCRGGRRRARFERLATRDEERADDHNHQTRHPAEHEGQSHAGSTPGAEQQDERGDRKRLERYRETDDRQIEQHQGAALAASVRTQDASRSTHICM